MVLENELQILNPIADRIGLPIDQVNFLVSEILALCVAFPFRTYLSVDKVGTTTRHITETVLGVLLCIFCFGHQIWHLLVQSLTSYVFMVYAGEKFSHKLVFSFSMLYLSTCHIYKQIYDYGIYTLDITGPLMIQTQKITSLAFSLHDGMFKSKKSLTQDQREQAVRKFPSILQYLSFMFYFHGILVGPLTFYNDYLAFIDGTNFSKSGSRYEPFHRRHPMSGLNKLVLRKLIICSAFCASTLILLARFCPPEMLNTPEFYSMTFLERMLYVLGVMTLVKHKYYFAWILADAINNAAGLGFTSYDDNGNPVWNLTENVDILGVELSSSLKTNIESWNKKTVLWLRRTVFDRSPFWRTLSSFACSAFWHGFYPGYYLGFGTAALMTVAARKVWQHIRPYFQKNEVSIALYEVITFIATRFANCYIAFPFILLEFNASIELYKSLYFYYHIISVVALIYFACVKKRDTPSNITPGFSGTERLDQESMGPIGTKSASAPDIIVRISRPEGNWQPTRVPHVNSAKSARKHKKYSDSV